MGHNSPDYIHTLIEAMKLSYADRDTYYADPAFVQIPAEGLLSKEYAKQRAATIDMKRASTQFIAGDPMAFDSKVKGPWPFWVAKAEADLDRTDADAAPPRQRRHPGTTHMSVIDKDGNMFDTTSSGG
jgi:gamma-glutamyltranspeptidase/glutathione hydrolase